MKFKVEKDELLKVLQKVTGIVPQRTSFEILTSIFIHTLENKIEISSTDLDMAITSSCNANVIQKGDVVINARRFHMFIKEVFDNEIEIEIIDKEFVIKTSNGNCKMPISEVGKFPQIPEFKKPPIFKMESSKFIDYIDRTSFIVSKDEMKPSITGVYFYVEDTELFIIATDGHRLVELRENNISPTGDFNAIIPPKSLNHLKRITEESSGEIEVYFESNSVGFRINNDFISSKIISGEYPKYKEIIPKDNDKLVLVKKDEFLSGIRRSSIFSSPSNHEVKFIFSDNMVNLIANTPEIGSTEEKIEIEYTGETLPIGFNAREFSEVLQRISSEQIILKLKNELSAALIIPETKSEDFNILYIMMPLRLE